MRRAACTALALGLLAGPARADDSLTSAAAAWLAGLEPARRSDAVYAFSDAERFDLRLAPFGLEGLRGDRMSDAQWEGLLQVFGTVLSASGLEKVRTIMSLEREVRQSDRGSWLRWPMQFMRDERRYFLALFGEPAPDATWGLRFDGHHLSLNWTAVPGAATSTTPLFLGSQPREVPADMERAGLRALAEEEDAARALVQALDATQRERASLPLEVSSAFGDRALFLGAGPRVAAAAPEGVPRRDLTPPQRALLDALIEVYVANFAGSVAEARRAAIRSGGRDAIHFAFAGGVERAGEPGYYRIQGPSFLIEYDDTVEAADHVHAVWREFDGDFGRDLLADHHANAHAASH